MFVKLIEDYYYIIFRQPLIRAPGKSPRFFKGKLVQLSEIIRLPIKAAVHE